jgi:hypothetical protein
MSSNENFRRLLLAMKDYIEQSGEVLPPLAAVPADAVHGSLRDMPEVYREVLAELSQFGSGGTSASR